MENPIEPDDLGAPLFLETPIDISSRVPKSPVIRKYSMPSTDGVYPNDHEWFNDDLSSCILCATMREWTWLQSSCSLLINAFSPKKCAALAALSTILSRKSLPKAQGLWWKNLQMHRCLNNSIRELKAEAFFF